MLRSPQLELGDPFRRVQRWLPKAAFSPKNHDSTGQGEHPKRHAIGEGTVASVP